MATVLPALDALLPDSDMTERHERLVHAPPERVAAAVRALRLRDVPLVALLVAVRAVPELATRRGRGRLSAADRPLLDQAVAAGFTELPDVPGQQVVLGLIGQVWRPGGEVVRPAGRQEFLDFAEPGFLKGVVGISVAAEDGGTRLVTVTRVRATDPGARRAFGRYWRLVGPFSGLIRVLLLRAIAERA